jgi:hypothetical protein
MINSAKQSAKRSQLFSSVQNDYKSVHDLPDGVILLDSVKTLEKDLQKRSLLKCQEHPLWFLAETERNIFLWRAGFSLEDVDLFEFWVDVNCLIDKRLKQIDNYDPENPFFNSLWGFSSGSPEKIAEESEYLKTFRDLLNSIISHASALSAVTSLLSKEIFNQEDRKLIILPGKLNRR